MKRSFATLLGLALLGALVPVVALASCAAADTQIRLAGFDADVEGAQVYVAVEGQSPAGSFIAERRGLSCVDEVNSKVDYELVPGTATPPRISVAGGNEGTLTLGAPPRDGGGNDDWRATKNFNVTSAEPNDVQHATIRLQNQTSAGLDQVSLGFPREAPVFVLDGGGSTSINFGLDQYERQESFVLDIPVLRSGPIASSASFNFQITDSGTNPAESEDYDVLTPGPLQFPAGDRVELIKIEMKKDSLSEPDEQFTITLQGTGVGNSAEVDVTIENLSPGSGSLRPTGRLHHPKNKYKYPQNYPWLNEIHIFTASADRDLTVRRAEMSIVKKLKNGRCRWWNGKRFVKQRCIDRRWFSDGIRKPAKDYFLHRLKQRLPLSVGKKSNVAYYEIRARWWDNRRNVSSLRVGRNQNRFDVIKPSLACKKNPYNFRKCKPVKP